MNKDFILKYLVNNLDKDDLNKSSLLAYNSDIEEVIKLAIKAKTLDRPLVVVKANIYGANQFYELISAYFNENEVVLYAPEESMRAEAIVASYENRADRLNALYRILRQKPKVIITTAYGLMRHIPSEVMMQNLIKTLKVGDILDKDDLIKYLNNAGYEKTMRAESPLTYASRGAIVDVFSVNYQNPIRIEFFDDEIDSIRFYDVNTQRTIENIKTCELVFASDLIFSDEEAKELDELKDKYDSAKLELDLEFIHSHIFSGANYYYYAFLKGRTHLLNYMEEPLVYLSDENNINDHIKLLKDETYEYLREMADEDHLPLRFHVFEEFNVVTRDYDVEVAEPFKEVFPLIETIDLPVGSIKILISAILKRKHKYIVLCLNNKELEEVIETLVNEGINYYMCTNDELKPGINLLLSDINEGFEVKKLDLVLYTSRELFQNKKTIGRYARKYEEATKLNSYDELKRGDYVVHNQYGIGQYVGIEKRVVNNISLDYLKIIYRGNDELLVPLTQFSLVRKYVSKDGVVPKLHKLGSKEWTKTKQRVEENIDDLAERLVALYALRNEAIGYAYSKDNEIQRSFENEFAYELTNDQAIAVEEVKKDMESPKPMDRLLCGDVGFGKTEVAIRASMKAVLDKKQVAYLCPTTVLSMQHYKTFKKRFINYPVTIEILNRYITPKEQKDIIKRVKEGKVDILLGTHRILSKDIKFNDLGLLIIDEEQRFGVEHKERIKELKNSVDVLSLSATPIPRTLQMSLVGLRGLSTLDTAPRNRYPVQTYVVEKNMGLIKEVMERELSRGGQVFYLHNNVDEIYLFANRVQKMIKDAKVIVAHGKMSREELEDVMMEFYQNKANILICTTIIETGIDIPNANTIIIDNAQNFGLSQLYQIKGRVGRSDKIAYAYLMVPPKKELSEVSTKRLNAIKEFTALGSGYKIAMRDLSIRGAGDMLGPKQSGFIDNVGLDLYLSMLENAIKRKRGEIVEEVKETVKPLLPLESYIPENFTQNDYEKLSLYHRLDEIKDKVELFTYYAEIKDEFGKLPKEVEALFQKKQLELLMEMQYIEAIKIIKKDMVVTLYKSFSDKIDGMKLFEYCNKLSRDLKIRYVKERIELSIQNQKDQVKKLLELLENLDEVVRR